MDTFSSSHLTGGFNFDNAKRNQRLLNTDDSGSGNGKYGKINGVLTKKTGTTICGVVADGCVVLAADTRATAGSIVADKNCKKLHHLGKTIYAAGAGTAADLEHQTEQIKSKLELLRLNTGMARPRIATVVARMSQHLFQYQGHCGVALVMGGYDDTGASLFKIHPHGSTDRLPFVAMGSGSLHAMGILEQGYRADLNKEEAVKLVSEAIKAGIMNDLGSGSNVDVVVITNEGAEMLRNLESPVPRTYRMPEPIRFQNGVTEVVSETFVPFN